MALLRTALWLALSGLAAALGQEGSVSDVVSLLQSGPGLGGGHIYYMHIPRTAGSSFTLDTGKVLVGELNIFNPLTLESKEGCYKWRDNGGPLWVATMLRSPRNHVLSQYLFCGEGTIALMTSVQKGPGGFGLWVNEWHDIFKRGRFAGDFTALDGDPRNKMSEQYLLFSSMPHKCYSPINLQTHHFTCTHPFIYEKEGTDIELALRNMEKTRFVGIQEAYQESLCLFASKVTEELPGWCDCRKESWKSFKPAGHVSNHGRKTRTPHNVSRQSPDVLRKIDELTSLDHRLYKVAVERFIDECRAVEERFEKKILCEDKIVSLRELASLRLEVPQEPPEIDVEA